VGKLVLIDGNAILHRAFHALPPLTTKRGEPINAVYGLVSMLLRVIQDLKPTHIAVCFDEKEPTFIHKAFPGYQAQRPHMADELSGQFEKARKFLEAVGIPIYSKSGYEADDVIGTLADKFKEVVEKMGIPPSQIDDYKALVGDSSDNYRGVSGIGPKTAIKLLSEYGSLENVYENISRLASQTKERLGKGRKDSKMSKKLATIVRDVPITADFEQASKWDVDGQRVLDLFSEFGFKTLTERVK